MLKGLRSKIRRLDEEYHYAERHIYKARKKRPFGIITAFDVGKNLREVTNYLDRRSKWEKRARKKK